jgi:hypothetical protein
MASDMEINWMLKSERFKLSAGFSVFSDNLISFD